METFFVVVMALVVLGVGALAVAVVRRFATQTDSLTDGLTDEPKGD